MLHTYIQMQWSWTKEWIQKINNKIKPLMLLCNKCKMQGTYENQKTASGNYSIVFTLTRTQRDCTTIENALKLSI